MREKEIDFVARHYRKGRFEAEAGWRRLGVVSASRWKSFRVAAAVAATIVLSATAALIYREYRTADLQRQSVEAPAATPLTTVKIIDFENASLSEVVRKIEEVYDVKVGNLPDDGREYQLSLHYEGTPSDLIGVINDILGTQLTVAEK